MKRTIASVVVLAALASAALQTQDGSAGTQRAPFTLKWGATGGSSTFRSASVLDETAELVGDLVRKKFAGRTDPVPSITLTKRLASVEALNRQTTLWQRRKAAYTKSRTRVDATLTATSAAGASFDLQVKAAYVHEVVTGRLATNPAVYTLKLTLSYAQLIRQR